MKKFIKVVLVLLILAVISVPVLYYGGKKFAHSYADKWADKLIELDSKNLLSTQFGAAWSDVVYGEAMEKYTDRIDGEAETEQIKVVEGIPVQGYPAISVVEKLNKINNYSNQILILDRKEREIARIKTDHQRVPYDKFPQTLVQSVVAAEDKTFFENSHGFAYESFVRAAARSVIESIKAGKKRSPRGTSTITQQVGKMFVSQLDSKGQRYVSRSVDRKLREIRIAAALRKKYSAEDIMEVYLNHCLTSSYGLIGAADVAEGLWGKPVEELTDAESVYLSRMVKWGVNLPKKIKRQCRIDMGRIQERLQWSDSYRDSVLTEIDALTFQSPKQISTEHGHLVDLANIYWLKFLDKQGYSKGEQRELDLLDPSSLIRKKGNLTIQLTIDLPLQTFLTEQITTRGYKDSVIVTDIRIGSTADTLTGEMPSKTPKRWAPRILTSQEKFSDPGSEYYTTIDSGKTIYTNISYDTLEGTDPSKGYRKVSRYYTRGKVPVNQYYAYGMLDSKTGELRAYASRDKIGSHCASLFGRPVPNGSSTIKPILNALMYDMDQFKIQDKWDDRVAVPDTVAWRRTFEAKGKGGQVYFGNTGSGKPYRVKNHGFVLEGNRYVYDQLTRSNNILAVETLYRLNAVVFDKKGKLNSEHFALGQLFLRLNIYDKMQKEYAGKMITGVRVLKELARIVGADVDSSRTLNGAIPIGDDLYSVALGTLEMTLLQQAHLFNMLYDNQLVEKPRDHPSLFIKRVKLGSEEFDIGKRDPVVRYNPLGTLGDKSKLRPTQLALFRRLAEWKYDIAIPQTSDTSINQYEKMKEYGAVSNFAKSGTTDDIRRPFFHDRLTPGKKTNYCLWNGVVRVDMAKFSGDSLSEISDITVACIGEGARGMSPGGRDGKSLHKFITKGLLKKAGKQRSNGFYTHYRKEIDSLWIADSLAVYTDSLLLDSLKLDSLRLDSIAKDSNAVSVIDSLKAAVIMIEPTMDTVTEDTATAIVDTVETDTLSRRERRRRKRKEKQ